MHADKVHDLAFCDVKAVANRIVKLHDTPHLRWQEIHIELQNDCDRCRKPHDMDCAFKTKLSFEFARNGCEGSIDEEGPKGLC